MGIELDKGFNACKDRSERRMRDTRTMCVPDVAFQHKWEERESIHKDARESPERRNWA